MPDSLGDRIRERRGVMQFAKEEVQDWAKSYTDNMSDFVRDYAESLRDALKNYVDNQITQAKAQSKTYVDAQLAAKIAKLATDNGLINNP